MTPNAIDLLIYLLAEFPQRRTLRYVCFEIKADITFNVHEIERSQTQVMSTTIYIPKLFIVLQLLTTTNTLESKN